MKYLIIRNDGIGDLIVSSPLISKIKKNDLNSEVHLICSNRNIKYAQILLKDGFIDKLYTSIDDLNKSKMYFKLIRKLSNIHFDYILILRASLSNLIFAKFLRSKSVLSIIAINKGKFFNKRYTPPLILCKLFLHGSEYIDCRNDYEYSRKLHMSSHLLNLLNIISSIKDLKNNLNYYLSPYLATEAIKYRKYIDKLYEINLKKVVLLHFDEKWDLVNHQYDKIFEFIANIQINTNATIIVSNGLIKNRYQDKLFNDLEFSLIKNSKKFFLSKKNRKILFFDRLELDELFHTVKLSDVVITSHGSMTHISSMHKINLIDLISFKRKFFFHKWRPLNKNSIQYDMNDLDNIIKKVYKYLEIKV